MYVKKIILGICITCYEIIDVEENETIPTNFTEKKATLKTHNYYILLVLLLITIPLLIDAGI